MFILDPRSELFSSRIPGSTKQHQIPDPDPQHCLQVDEKKFSKFSVIVTQFFKTMRITVPVPYYTLRLSLTILEGEW